MKIMRPAPQSRTFARASSRGLWVGLASIAFGFGATGVNAAANLAPPDKRAVDFVRDIQPILSARCYSCHGPEKQKGELRWDSRTSAFKTGDNGPIIVPGKSMESRVIKLVAGLDPDTVMPPKGEPLTAQQVGLLRAWIDQGAVWPDAVAGDTGDKRNHWAFKAPVRPAVPVVRNKGWVRNPIDNFVLGRLEKEHLNPAPEAQRTTLIRRVTLDLTGLPPTIGEVDRFLGDTAPEAYEQLVERLLGSPHYGELWARHWLDVARYADTNGYEKDRPRSIWPYRDWVIRALNRDIPFNEFIIDQLAGDLLPHPSTEQRVATGFLRNSMLNQEGGIEPEEFRVAAIIDRMDTVGKACLGLTINCCQCHNHKFDPISQKEYYELFAFLNNDDEAFLEVPTAAEQKERETILKRVRELEENAVRSATNLDERMSAWEKSLPAATPNWVVLDPKESLFFGSKFDKHEDLSLLGGGDLQPGGIMHVWVDTPLTNITGFRLEALTNANLMYGGPGETGRGSFLLKEFTVQAWAMNHPTVTNTIRFRRALADAEAPGHGITNAIDGHADGAGWTPTLTPEHRNENHCAVFECTEPVGFPGGTHLLITLDETYDSKSKLDCHTLGSLRLSATTDATPLGLDPVTAEQRRLLGVPASKRSLEQERELFSVFRHYDPQFSELNQQIDAAWLQWPYPATTLVLARRAHPRVTHVFKRGDWLRPAEVVQPDVPAVLNPFPADAPRDRLGLAEWITDPRSPTTARVAVNRLWQAYFGEGLVSTPEDFGTRVERPSHPELLDWLACELMHPTWTACEPRGELPAPWSLKHIHRLIVTSATYRQASNVTPEIYAKDRFDRLLERAPRVRVEGEVVQDIALSASGLLDLKVGGPSVFPPIPSAVGDTSYGGFSWPESKGADRFRRGMYTFWKRSLPFPALSAFDVPTGETSCPRRVRSNTPLQALTTLNEKTFVEAAQAMALRVLKEGGGDTDSRARYAFRLCTSREPSGEELGAILKFWQEQYEQFENDTARAVKVAVPDINQMPPDVNLHKVAAWAMVSRALLNLDETITRE